MALKTPYLFRGINISEAYVRIDRISGGKQQGSWQGEFSIYQSEAAANSPQPEPALIEDEPEQLPDGLTPALKPDPLLVARVLPQPPLAGFSITVPWEKAGVPEKLLYAAAKKQEMLSNAVDA